MNYQSEFRGVYYFEFSLIGAGGKKWKINIKKNWKSKFNAPFFSLFDTQKYIDFTPKKLREKNLKFVFDK